MTPVVDAHHHLWDADRRDYPWLEGLPDSLRRPHTLSQLQEVTASAGVRQTILVQTVSDVAETVEFLGTAARSDGLIRGVVGWVDLAASDLPATLDRLEATPGGDRLVGIRHQVHDEPDPGWLLRPAVIRGLTMIADRGLAYDLLVRSRELPVAVRVARSVDTLRLVVDHGGKPDIAQGEVEPWASRMAELAAFPQVSCKLSGLLTRADPGRWRVEDLRPYVDRLLALFGPSRLLFGSDWPVSTLAASYPDVLAATRSCLSDLSADESADVFGGTAVRVYERCA